MGFDTSRTTRRPTLGNHGALPVPNADRVTTCKRCRHIIRADQKREWSREPRALGLIHVDGECP